MDKISIRSIFSIPFSPYDIIDKPFQAKSIKIILRAYSQYPIRFMHRDLGSLFSFKTINRCAHGCYPVPRATRSEAGACDSNEANDNRAIICEADKGRKPWFKYSSASLITKNPEIYSCWSNLIFVIGKVLESNNPRNLGIDIRNFLDYILSMVLRKHFMKMIRNGLSSTPITAIFGPRQCGKTTLARLICEEAAESHYLDLERPETLARLQSPQTTLEALRGLIVIDEIQLKPELFSLLRVLADRPDTPAQFLILGSASPSIIRNTAQTLAGRVHFVDLSGFNLEEVGGSNWRNLWIQGGFPCSYLASPEKNSATWRENFIRTLVEKDIPALGFHLPPQTIHRFWTMVAHSHGQAWNGSELGRALGATDKTVRNYVDLLTGTYMVRQLPPWFENITKRQVKAPKIYLRDSGILHQLLHLSSETALLSYPKYGASWEGFAIEQILRRTGERDAYFWSTHNGAKLDLLLLRKGKRFGFEFKYADAPRTTRSMHIAIDTLHLEQLWVIHPGHTDYPLTEKIHVVGIENLYPEILGQL